MQKKVLLFPGEYNIRKYHAVADIFCYPALSKGMSVLEAMAAGLPVVGKRTDRKPLVVEHMISGLMTEPTKLYKLDPGQITEKLNFLLKRPKVALKMGMAARERVEKIYSLDRHIIKILKVYKNVLNSHQRRLSLEINPFLPSSEIAI